MATLTAKYVKAVEGLPVKILDTRKTVPGFRVLDKYAVAVGGGFNHRFGLYDGILIKDNHIKMAGGISNAVQIMRKKYKNKFKIEVEASNLEEVKEALISGADIIMLDNMDTGQMEKGGKAHRRGRTGRGFGQDYAQEYKGSRRNRGQLHLRRRRHPLPAGFRYRSLSGIIYISSA